MFKGVSRLPKDLKYTILFDIYSPLLTEKQRDTFDKYYNEDLSLSEISEMYGGSRQNVLHCIQLTEKKLMKLEDELSLAEKFRVLTKKTDELEALLKKEKLSSETKIFETMTEIKELL